MREAIDIARDILNYRLEDEHTYDVLATAIAAAIEKDRAETIERCARVAEEKRFTHLCGSCGLDDEEYLGRANAVAAAKDIAKAIRSLSTPPRAEP